jgi:hypothetical protein
MKSVLPFRGDDTLMYSITYDLTTPESRELGSFEESGYIVEPTEGELQDILLQANRDYGIYMPVGVGSFANPIAPEDNDYFTKGHEKYYTLFINKTDGSRLNQEELDFVTALLNEGKYSFDEDSNRFYEWGGTPEFGIGGWIGGTLIGGFLGYQVGKAVGYGRAVQGYAGGGEVSNEEYQMVVNHWVYFTFNYPMGFLEKSFGTGAIANHLQGKFSSFYERYGANAVMPKFWSELDSGNQRKLSDFVKNNYVNSQEQFEKLKNVSDENYSKIVNHWTMFGFNYPSEWLKKVFNNNTDHYTSKFSRAYQRAGSLGAMNMFYTELDGGNQSILAEWVMKNYSGTKLEQGGSTYQGGGEIISELKGEREHNPKMGLTDAQINDLVADVIDEVGGGKPLSKALTDALKGEREVNPKMKMTDAQINDLVADINSGSTYQGGGDIPEGFHQMPDGTIMPDSAHYGLGGLLLAGGFGAYVGYKIGRAKPKKKGFETEKKIARKVKSKLKYAGGGEAGNSFDDDDIAVYMCETEFGDDWFDGENYKDENVEAFYIAVHQYIKHLQGNLKLDKNEKPLYEGNLDNEDKKFIKDSLKESRYASKSEELICRRW